MIEKNSKIPSKAIKSLLNELRQSMPEIKRIFLTPIAYAIAVTEKYLKDASENRKQARLLSEKISKERFTAELAAKSNQVIQERKLQEEYKIAEEIRAEERAKKAYREKLKLTPRKLIHTVLAATSTIALVIGVTRLAPIAKWSLLVNECIEDISSRAKYKDVSTLEKIRLCNKGAN